ncbi:dTDP-glucose 4,6-dehydratase [Alteromonas sediminis]|uniref:dTDP-glucose 4,6-dehydratase n=1 Tax=Alteromonas sediminis TaxID=2259342 RepID=A0A3N5ZDN8_9ALTE|nr:dTDP-glucose 4,6-dehydratase [Alteromonas sediminis]RPJ68288.1 dTDP-glucose 4,6-dehydratase [Alteromonas sediminis]
MQAAKSLLVTGGAGFIGVNFVRYWLENYPKDRVVVLDALTYSGNYESLRPIEDNPQFSFVHGDICDQVLVENVMREHTIDTVVHFAAESHVDKSITGPKQFITTNIMGTFSLLEAARALWLGESPIVSAHRFHHVSTDEVYGTLEENDPAFSESTPYAPNSPYSASKAASDHLVRAYLHTYGLQVTTSNCSNNYGPYHFPEKLIPLVLTNILYDKAIPVYGDGKQIRDWLYVEDHARGIDLILNEGKVGECYNIGGINEWANIDIVNLLCRMLNKAFVSDTSLQTRFPQATKAAAGDAEALISFVTDRPGHDRRYAIDPTKSQTQLNYAPKESFETGIAKTVSWYLDNPEWWTPLLK